MDLTHRFSLPTGVDNAWATFNRLERLEPCFPGATVTSIDGDDFAGSMRIKLGPFGLVYEGQGRYVKRDERHRRLVIEASGADHRGHGTGSAKVTATFTGDATTTEVEVRTDLTLDGRPAQLGRGVVDDISDRLLDQFVSCIAARFDAGLTAEGVDAEHAGIPGTTHEPSVRRVAEHERLDVGAAALPAFLKRAAPLLAAIGAVLALILLAARKGGR